MKDKKSTELADKYWKEMKSVLDKEMPISKRRKNIPWFLLLGSVASFVIWISLIIIQPNSLHHKANDELQYEPDKASVNQMTSSTDKNVSITIPKKNLSLVSNNGIHKNFNSKNYTTMISKTSHGIVYTDLDLNNSNLITNRPTELEPTQHFNNSVPNNATINSSDSPSLIDIKPLDPINPNTIEVKAENHNNLEIQLLDISNMGILTFNRIKPNLSPKITTHQDKGFKLGLGVAAISHDFKAFGQFKGGFVGQFTVKRNFNISGGIQYAYFSRNAAFSQKVLDAKSLDNSILDNIYSNTASGATHTNNTEQLQELDIISKVTNKLHYINFSIGTGWNISNHLALEGQFSYYRLVSAEYKVNEQLNESLVGNGFIGFEQSQLDTKEPIHRQNLYALSLGAHYKITDKLFLGLHGIIWPGTTVKVNESLRNLTADQFEKYITNQNNQKVALSSEIGLRYMW
jgi:hypothetical protein